jgi:hypothetical protein
MLPPALSPARYVVESGTVTVRTSYSPLARWIAYAGAVIDVTIL